MRRDDKMAQVFTAPLDTSILWPSLQRDFLLSLAIEGMYRPAWSATILEELEYHETAKLIRRGEAAVVAGAGAIITHNLRDFPPDRLPIGINALPPAEFAASTVSLDPVRARAAVTAIAARSGRKGPPLTEDEVLDALADRYSMTRTAEILRSVR